MDDEHLGVLVDLGLGDWAFLPNTRPYTGPELDAIVSEIAYLRGLYDATHS